MSDTTQSGDTNTTPVAPAETASAPAQPAAPAFGTSRGSGLGRGKRATHTVTESQTAPAAGYQPTAIQVVNTAREYKNPFAPAAVSSEATSPAPAAEQPAAPAAPAAALEEQPAEGSARVSRADETRPESRPTETIQPQPAPTPAPEPAPEKAEIKILPPEEKPHRAQSWESDSFPAAQGQQRQGDRAVFQPRGQDQRGERGDRRNRDRRDFRRDNPAGQQPSQQPAASKPPYTPALAPEQKKSGGFIGWIKGIFGGTGDETEKPADKRDNDPRTRRDNREGGGRRHHHRGGRNRGNQGGGGYHQYGNQERRFDRGDRGDRSRQRGGERGRGSHRYDRGNGNPPPEGHSGGGAI